MRTAALILLAVTGAIAADCYLTVQVADPSYGADSNSTFLASVALTTETSVTHLTTLSATDNKCLPSNAFIAGTDNVIVWSVVKGQLIGHIYIVPSGKAAGVVNFGSMGNSECPFGKLFILPENVWCIYARTGAMETSQLRCNASSSSEFTTLWQQPIGTWEAMVAPVVIAGTATQMAVIDFVALHTGGLESMLSLIDVETGKVTTANLTGFSYTPPEPFAAISIDVTGAATIVIPHNAGSPPYSGTSASGGNTVTGQTAPISYGSGDVRNGGGDGAVNIRVKGSRGAKEAAEGRGEKGLEQLFFTGSSSHTHHPPHNPKYAMTFYSVPDIRATQPVATKVHSIVMEENYVPAAIEYNGEQWVFLMNPYDGISFMIYTYTEATGETVSYGPIVENAYKSVNDEMGSPVNIYCPASSA